MSPLTSDFYKTATLCLLVDIFFFIKRNYRMRLACLVGAGFLAFIQPLAIVGASKPVSAQTPILPSYLKQIPPAAPMSPTSLAEQPEAVPPPPPSLPVAAYQTYSNTYDACQCTWFVASRKHVPNSWGNANTWALRATLDGYTVSETPLVGSIGVSTGGQYGHVVIVEAVNSNSVTIVEMNEIGPCVIDERVINIAGWRFIYV